MERDMISLNHKANCFDLMRHVAAMAVLVSHHSALSKVAVPKFLGMVSYGNLSVTIFFAISGYLVTNSYYRSSSFWSYFEKRLRRLFPGLIVCSAIMVFGLCALLGKDSFFAYAFSARGAGSFINSVWLEGFRDANGFTSDYIYPNAVNGSLWTLRYEFFSYILIPAAIIFLKRGAPAIILILLASFAYQALYYSGHVGAANAQRFTALLIPYCVGALMLYCAPVISGKRNAAAISAISILSLILMPKTPELSSVFNALIAVLTIIIGVSFKDKIIGGKFDFSYGIYIYAFPAQQMMINLTSLGFYQSMFASAIVTTVIAAGSWYFVEKPFITRLRKAPADQESTSVATRSAT